ILPRTNVEHLMLKGEVREAIEQGQFRVFAISRVDEALSLLTGLPIGEADGEGRFPEGSLEARVAERLAQFREAVTQARRDERGLADGEAGEGGDEEGDGEDEDDAT
ncbi:MAG: ATP-dependent protease, partial [Halomonas sp.]|nr:ATP-dependent protease [Halomonas sp.]